MKKYGAAEGDQRAAEGDQTLAAEGDQTLEPSSKRRRTKPKSSDTGTKRQRTTAHQPKSSGTGKVMKKPSAAVARRQNMREHEEDTLVFEYPNVALKPRFIGAVTIYNDRTRYKWRVKPGPGRRDDKCFPYKRNAKKAWDGLVRHIKSLKSL